MSPVYPVVQSSTRAIYLPQKDTYVLDLVQAVEATGWSGPGPSFGVHATPLSAAVCLKAETAYYNKSRWEPQMAAVLSPCLTTLNEKSSGMWRLSSRSFA